MEATWQGSTDAMRKSLGSQILSFHQNFYFLRSSKKEVSSYLTTSEESQEGRRKEEKRKEGGRGKERNKNNDYSHYFYSPFNQMFSTMKKKKRIEKKLKHCYYLYIICYRLENSIESLNKQLELGKFSKNNQISQQYRKIHSFLPDEPKPVEKYPKNNSLHSSNQTIKRLGVKLKKCVRPK